jgi:hypothetical protein
MYCCYCWSRFLLYRFADCLVFLSCRWIAARISIAFGGQNARSIASCSIRNIIGCGRHSRRDTGSGFLGNPAESNRSAHCWKRWNGRFRIAPHGRNRSTHPVVPDRFSHNLGSVCLCASIHLHWSNQTLFCVAIDCCRYRISSIAAFLMAEANRSAYTSLILCQLPQTAKELCRISPLIMCGSWYRVFRRQQAARSCRNVTFVGDYQNRTAKCISSSPGN